MQPQRGGKEKWCWRRKRGQKKDEEENKQVEEEERKKHEKEEKVEEVEEQEGEEKMRRKKRKRTGDGDREESAPHFHQQSLQATRPPKQLHKHQEATLSALSDVTGVVMAAEGPKCR